MPPESRDLSASSMRNRSIPESFARAFEGLSHVLWTQRSMRAQLFIAMLAFLLGFYLRVTTTEFLLLAAAVAVVMVSEIFNTAIEVVVNMVTESYHPLAKVAKDVAAAGVLVASVFALIVGAAIFIPRSPIPALLGRPGPAEGAALPGQSLIVLILLGVFLLFVIVPLSKVAMGGHGSLLRGGSVSGHAAVAFLLFAAIVIASEFQPLPSLLGLVLAVLVAQSRVEGKIHTLSEVLWGAAVALVLAALLWASQGQFGGA